MLLWLKKTHTKLRLVVGFITLYESNKKAHNISYELFCGTPKGIRTPAASVKGMCPRPLDDGSLSGVGGIFSATAFDNYYLIK